MKRNSKIMFFSPPNRMTRSKSNAEKLKTSNDRVTDLPHDEALSTLPEGGNAVSGDMPAEAVQSLDIDGAGAGILSSAQDSNLIYEISNTLPASVRAGVGRGRRSRSATPVPGEQLRMPSLNRTIEVPLENSNSIEKKLELVDMRLRRVETLEGKMDELIKNFTLFMSQNRVNGETSNTEVYGT